MSARVTGDAGLVEAIRARRDKGFEPIRRDAVQDGRLSMKARGILAYLVSMPDRWRTNAEAIAKGCDKDGREAIANGLKELEEHGYLARRRRHTEDGRFVWAWIYSDDPAEVAEILDVMFPDAPGARAAIQRGRARAAAKPQVDTINGFAADGDDTIDGFAADGKPVDIERQQVEKTPPTPRAAGGADVPADVDDPPAEPCEAHGRRSCRPCGTSPRARAWAERDATEADLERRERQGRDCRMCKDDGPARGGGTRWLRVVPGGQVPVTPYVVCDHTTSHTDVMASLAERDQAPDPTPAVPAPSSTTEGRARARQLVVPRARGASGKPRRRLPGEGVPESVREELAASRGTVPGDTGGQDGAQPDEVDHVQAAAG